MIRMSSYGAKSRSKMISGIPQFGTHAGDVYWVDANAPGNKGTFNFPCATLDAATSLCTNDNGDIVIIKPGHSETITGAGGITFDKSGVTYLGLGTYDDRPEFLMDAADSVSCLVTAANVHVENCVFRAGYADVTVFTTITAKGSAWVNNHIESNTTDENFVTVFSVSANDNDADGLWIEGNVISQGDDASDLHAIILNKNINDAGIVGNRIVGDYMNTPFAPIYMATAEVPKNIIVDGNLIHNGHDGDNVVGISMDCITATGWIVNNHCSAKDSSGETPFLGGSAGLFLGENYYSGTPGTASGYIYPTIDS